MEIGSVLYKVNPVLRIEKKVINRRYKEEEKIVEREELVRDYEFGFKGRLIDFRV